jgi:hypothetical protein
VGEKEKERMRKEKEVREKRIGTKILHPFSLIIDLELVTWDTQSNVAR